jgi:hypothetical protein
MGRSFGGNGKWHESRGNLATDKNSRRAARRRDKQAGHEKKSGFFVPSFGLRRPAVNTPELREFLGEVKKSLPNDYDVCKPRHIGLNLLEQIFIVEKFRAIRTHADPEKVFQVAQQAKKLVGESLKEQPERTSFSFNGSGTFGRKKRHSKVGLDLQGWNGHHVDYDFYTKIGAVDLQGEDLVHSRYVTETAICVGAVHNGFTDYEDLPGFMNVSSNNARPHLTIAQKRSGAGYISYGEGQEMTGRIDELAQQFGEVDLGDPIMSIRLSQHEKSLKQTVRIPGPAKLSIVPPLDDLAS